MSHETDLAWCAGFFDGEGHVSYKRSYPSKISSKVSPMLMCSVPQNSENVEVLEFFQATVGLGKIRGPYPTKSGTQHRLLFKTKDVDKLLIMLKPYLKSKKTLDFQVALMSYWMHDSEPTERDWERAILKKSKNMR